MLQMTGKTELKDIIEQGKENRRVVNKNPKCVFCGCTNRIVLTCDHKIALSQGGDDTPKNKQTTCWICNNLKSTLTNEEFRKYLRGLNNLYDLCKIKLQFPKSLPIIFNQYYYPAFNAPVKKEEDGKEAL